MAELKPCPFCGGEAKLVVTATEYSRSAVGWRFGIECRRCPIRLGRENYELKVYLDDTGEVEATIDERDEAIAAWNRRPIDGPT